MAKHRPTPAPAKPRLTRRAARYALRLPWRLARLVLRSALATLRGAWWLTRGLAVGTVGLAGLAVVVPLVVLALLAGRSGVQLRDALVTYVLEPFGKRVQAKRNPLPEPAPAPAPAKSKGKGKAKGKAKAKGKSVGELETVEFQIATMDGVTESDQVLGVSQTIEKMSEIGKTFGPMLTAWSTGDTEGLAKIMNEGVDKMPAFRKALFVDRNAKRAKWIGQRLEQPGTVFVAVGAGHLAGADSVQDFLAKKGIKAAKVSK